MHRSVRFALLAATICLTSSTSATSQEKDHLLLEDSFENGDTAPNGWKQGANITGVDYVYDKTRAKTGDRSLSLQKSANRYFPIAQWRRMLPNPQTTSALRVAAQVRAEKAFKAVIDVQFVNEDGETFGHKWAAYIGARKSGDPPADHDWKEYSGVVDIPDGTKRIALALQIYGPGKVWFDDLNASFVDAGESKEESAAAIEIKVGDGIGRYLFSPAKSKQPPKKGYALLVVLPGGDGSADFHPFVKRIQQNSLGNDFALAQPIATKWSDDQHIVWPTARSRADGMKYTTEEFITAVVDHVAAQIKVDRDRVYLLAWSSGGPAAYATLLQKKSPATGGLIAMSVFKPKLLPELGNAKGRSIYLLHSPHDRVCPYWLAKAARDALTKAGVRTTLVDYEGGHGWKGNVYGNIRRGVEWLEKSK